MQSTEMINDFRLSAVELEVNSKCNRRCGYCPVSILPPPVVPEYMPGKIIDKILCELSLIGFSSRISYHFYNEPLLHPHLEQIVCKVKEKLPGANQVLYTNGDRLTEDKYYKLKRAGINYFRVTKHDFMPFPNRPHQTILFPYELQICNRGGTMSKTKEPLFLPCYAPSEVLIVSASGDVLLCCNDSRRNCIMGNITEQSLREIWFSKEFCRLRQLLEAGKRKEAYEICKYCDNMEYSKKGDNKT